VTQRKNQRRTNGHDDASAAALASTALVAGTGADRQLSGDAASPRVNGETHQAAGNSQDPGPVTEQIPGADSPLPASPGEFVEEIHRRIDLFEVWLGLLREKDDKIRQRAVEKLTEMCYKGAAALAEEPRRIIIDMPEPIRD
jgi:hypothetical protein